MTELKNTLSGVCYLGAMLVYLDFDRSRKPSRYLAALALFVIALLSKSVTATLPAALLVVFWWQRGRLDWRRDIAPLAPWLAVGAGAGLLTAWVERTQIGAQGAAFNFNILERCLIAGRVICFYLSKLLWPSNLIFNYPRWRIDAGDPVQYLFPVGVLALLAALWALRRRTRAPLAAMLLFCGTLAPALGFVNVYPFVFSFVADHFQYLASLAIIALVSAGIIRAAVRSGVKATVAEAAAMVLVGAPLLIFTWHQARQYTDAITLYQATLARNPASLLALNNLGSLELDAADDHVDDAMVHLQEAVRLDPEYVEAHVNLGVALQRRGRLDEAVVQYRVALRIAPGAAKARQNLGLALLLAGRREEAAPYLLAAQQELEQSNEPEVHISLGDSMMGQKRPAEALAEFEKGVTLLLARRPAPPHKKVAALRARMSEAHNDIGVALAGAGRLDEAVKEYREAVHLHPGAAASQNNLGYALFQMHQTEEAVTYLREAVKLQPDYVVAETSLGDALLELGRNEEAIVELTAAVLSASGKMSPELQNDLGVALGRVGRLDESVPHFREAVRLKPDFENAKVNLHRVLVALGGKCIL
jgi:Flp pilus assembly protein TadD